MERIIGRLKARWCEHESTRIILYRSPKGKGFATSKHTDDTKYYVGRLKARWFEHALDLWSLATEGTQESTRIILYRSPKGKGFATSKHTDDTKYYVGRLKARWFEHGLTRNVGIQRLVNSATIFMNSSLSSGFRGSQPCCFAYSLAL